MRISTVVAFARPAAIAVACLAVLVSGCSGTGSFPGPSWNLTGSKETTRLPAKTAVTAPAPDHQLNAYRGGRDPVSGRAAPVSGSSQAFPLPPALPPSGLQTPTALSAPSSSQPPAPFARAAQVEVRPGQSLAAVASEQRVSIASLMAANKLRDPYVIPGQTLVIPRP